MFATPASFDNFGNQLTRDAAESLSRNWTTLLLNGLVLIVAGVLIWSIDWSVRSLSTFLGALFIFEGIWIMLTAGISGRGANYATGLLSIAAGIAIIAWPGPSLTVLGIFLGCWLIVIGTISISGAFAARRVLPDWWMLLLLGLAEVPLWRPRSRRPRRDARCPGHGRRDLGRSDRSHARRARLRGQASARGFGRGPGGTEWSRRRGVM